MILDGRSTLMTFRDAHTSVIGLREIASCEQVIITESESLEEFLQSREKLSQNGDLHESNQSKSLFVMTAASNFCGRKYDLSMINRLQKGKNAFFHWIDLSLYWVDRKVLRLFLHDFWTGKKFF